MPEVLAPAVLDEQKILRPFLAQNTQKHTGHHHQGVGGKTVRTLHVSVGEKSPVNKGGSIHQKNGVNGKIKAVF